MILNFHDYINEKLGTLSRIYQETDEFKISEIVNDFVKHILENPDDNYKTTKIILDRAVEINYIPKENSHVRGVSYNEDTVIVYKKINKDNYLDVKYILIHELVHIIQQITSTVDDRHLSFSEILRRKLIQPSIEQLEYNGESTYFMYMLYRENLREIYAWSNDAYELAFTYKKKYPHKSNQDVVKYVLDEVQMSHKFLNIVIEHVKNDISTFEGIISILIGHFSILDGIPKQIYFSKDVFKLDVVKLLKREVKKIIYNNNDINDIENRIVHLVNLNMSKLLDVKNIITDSFIEHLKYCHKEALTKWGKSIQLGMDDANI